MIQLRSKRGNDDGYVMIWALAVMLVVLAAVAALTLLGIRSATNSGKFRDRATAISAAEGQVDVMVSRITSAVTASPTAPAWPCAPLVATITDAGPHPTDTSTTVTYYDANGLDVGCPGPNTLVRSATVRAIATGPVLPSTLPVRRVMEALLTFAGGDTVKVPIFALPRSMFSDEDVVFNNSVTVTQVPGVDLPSLYTNGSFSCANNTGLAGDLIAQRGVAMTNSCTVGGNVASGAAVDSTSTQARIGGSIVALGDVNVTGGVNAVGGAIRTAGLAWWGSCTSTRCASNDPTVAAPATETLPGLPWNADVEAAWADAGWTIVKFENPADCTEVGGTNAPGQWLTANALIAGPKTVIRTICPVSIGNNSTITLARDVAVVADGGVAFNTSTHFRAATAQSLYFIQPTNAVSAGCTGDGISLNNNITFQPTISLMLFTPCNIVAAQSLDVTGQVYAGGALTFHNSVRLQFRPMPMPIPNMSSNTVNAYVVKVTAKREGQ